VSGFLVTRRIGIDAGHRIMTHGSKCRHIHGHRYEIEASCRAARLHDQGEQSGMALDFGFLKEEMMAVIDGPCDHGFIAQTDDGELLRMFAPQDGAAADDWIIALREKVALEGFAETTDCRLGTKLYVLPVPPTAEQLAEHWFNRLAARVAGRSGGVAELARLRVWETPNCWADYGLAAF
jgi:6-pyruvoyltetrahydropterin/6-carboxytetrahydropterin synthase